MSYHKIRVAYTVTFECTVLAKGGEDVGDLVRDIDIPEGGIHESAYRENTFDVIEVHDPREASNE